MTPDTPHQHGPGCSHTTPPSPPQASQADPRRALASQTLANLLKQDGHTLEAPLSALSERAGVIHAVFMANAQTAPVLSALKPRLEQALEKALGQPVRASFMAQRGAAREALAPGAPKPAHHGQAEPGPAAVPGGIHAALAVASGKGGVGKSTVAVNLACGLAKLGLRVGLLDADIHGPSIARMMGAGKAGKPEVKGGKLIPLTGPEGVRYVSIALLADERQAMIWRGPMVMGALTQLIKDVVWGELDLLVVDMPPGTGDAQITLTKTLAPQLAKGGAVVVSTPQAVALMDARRGLTLFERTKTPVLGLVENMSFFACPHCQGETALFGHGGVAREAEALNVPFLGEVPLLPAIREGGDEGVPSVSEPGSAAGKAFMALAKNVAASLASRQSQSLGGEQPGAHQQSAP
ncbi:Mrp/NBP35 family ATP-binding protein [Formicincola oecophyllae]|uniref:Iron-sulfur cluster carrier protein n=1 Tax=Formicincola oecophyllae TaxID=2558361 RepID=A0A4Y6U9A0_9PROT|nr:Mrp/NBP35 family ATP-binding protein [Formicincola oecophyllae]QDH14039.1 Mrp/NBP35 family ATP-binding protein [Formicincola oecophyllae]